MYSVEKVGQLTLFPQGTREHANLTVLPGSDKARMTTALSGQRLSGYWKRSDPVGLLVRMLLDTSHWGSTACFLTWTTSGTPLNRLYFQLQLSEHHTEGTAFSLLPTPRANKVQAKMSKNLAKRYKSNLEEDLSRIYPDQHGKYLNPQFVEWMQGFSENWTKVD